MIDTESISRAKLKRVPLPAVIDPNQRYSLAETHAALSQSHAKTFQDIKLGRLYAASRLERTSAGIFLGRAVCPGDLAGAVF